MNTAMTSPAAQVVVAVIPIVGIVIGGIVVFFYLLWRHHEVKLQIQKGTYAPRELNIKMFALLAGLLLVCVGLMLSILFALLDGLSYTLLGGLIPTAIGIGLLVFCKLIEKTK
jgi:uncharacterized membrane protein YidH (DUF202 family)